MKRNGRTSSGSSKEKVRFFFFFSSLIRLGEQTPMRLNIMFNDFLLKAVSKVFTRELCFSSEEPENKVKHSIS